MIIKFSYKIFTLISLFSLAAESKPKINFCHEDQDSYPWVLKNGTGINIEHLSLVAHKLNITINFIPMPWNRCLEEMKKGNVDGAFAASFKVERLEYGLYPTKVGKIDDSKKLHTNQYSLYTLKEESQVKWDGKNISGLNVVGSLSGYSINDFFLKRNIRIDDGTRLPISILEKLLSKRFTAVALQDNRADYIINSNPQFKNSIIKLSPPLEKKSYFLMFSKQFKESNSKLAENIWESIKEVRESNEFQSISNKFLKL